MRATCSIAISIWTQSQGHDQGLLFKDKDFSSKDKDSIVKDKDQHKDCILVLKESLRTRTNITAPDPRLPLCLGWNKILTMALFWVSVKNTDQKVYYAFAALFVSMIYEALHWIHHCLLIMW